jgi:predicted acetyltransferase
VLIRNGKTVLGEFRFRPTVPPPYLSNNGHVGYNVRPSERRQGYASRGLALVLAKARELGLEGLMIPINSVNVGSIRTTEKNGGVLARQDVGPGPDEVTSWYWIKL